MSADADLLRRYANEGADAAFTELVRRHINLVYGAALRRCGGDAHRAEDVTQQVFTALARQARSLTHHTVLTAWFYTTTRNIAVDLIRAERSRAAREQEAATMRTMFSAGQPDADWTQFRPVLDDAMDELADADRTAILLRYFQQRPFAEIGSTLRVSEDAARMRVERALDKLRVLLARRGVTSTSAVLASALAHEAAIAAPAGLVASVSGTALSGAAATAPSSLAGALSIMSASKVVVPLGVAVAVVITAAVYQTSQAETAAAALAETRRNHAALVDHVDALEHRASAAEKELADRKADSERRHVTKADTMSSAVAAPDVAERARTDAALQRLLDSDVLLGNLRLETMRSRVRLLTGAYLQSVGLTAGQIDEAADVVVRLGQQMLLRSQATLPLDRGTLETEIIAQLRTKLGHDVAEKYLRANAANIVQGFLVAPLYYADAPFTLPQVQQLTNAIWNARPSATGWPSDAWLRRNVDWDRVLGEAEAFLAPAQVQGLRSMAAKCRMDAQKDAAAAEATIPLK